MVCSVAALLIGCQAGVSCPRTPKALAAKGSMDHYTLLEEL